MMQVPRGHAASGRFWRRALGLIALAVAQGIFAAEPATAPLTQGHDAIAAPGLGRVLAVFLLVCVLGVTVIVGLRRLLPRFGAGSFASGDLQSLARIDLGGGLRVHMLEADRQKVLIVESRHGVSIAPLRTPPEQVPVP